MNKAPVKKTNGVDLFSTKAQTLKKLTGQIQTASILPLKFFTYRQWLDNASVLLAEIFNEIGSGPFIVRSSCTSEDTLNASNAGAYLSILGVSKDEMRASVEKVFQSYGIIDPADEVLVQPLLKNVVFTGVAFSHDQQSGSPYRVINYTKGHDTTTITGGGAGETWFQHAHSTFSPPKPLNTVLELINELEATFGKSAVDCEFAITDDGTDIKLWLLQARPLFVATPSMSDAEQFETLLQLERFFKNNVSEDPFLLGRKTMYGVMPDWNPAEIIGVCPKPLAFSLYKELVTDSIWAYQRHNYGYRNLRSFPLMLNFGGRPYIDVRVSFNSFVPADLDDELGSKLVDHYISTLASYPKLHDKVEFEIVLSCYTFSTQRKMTKLKQNGFSSQECDQIVHSLRGLTKNIVDPLQGLWRKDREKIVHLQKRYDKIHRSNLSDIDKIYWLLEDTKRYGTLPFAGLARAAFIAMQLLNSLKSEGIFSDQDYDNFLSSLNTVGGEIWTDKAKLTKSAFLSKYGHLRPGTYDITSARYDEAPDLYFRWDEVGSNDLENHDFSLTLNQMGLMREILKKHELGLDPIELLEFIRSAIELREWAKFHFSKNLSDALSLILSLGKNVGYDVHDLAFLDIRTILDLRSGSFNIKEEFGRSIDTGKRRFAIAKSIKLPPLMTNSSDIWGFDLPDTTPNFVTSGDVTGHVSFAENRETLDTAIVFIPNADPGYDWLFACNIAGIVTEWGGINSHMAIRASELGLPSVIGAGEKLYSLWSKAEIIRLDCSNNKVEIIR